MDDSSALFRTLVEVAGAAFVAALVGAVFGSHAAFLSFSVLVVVLLVRRARKLDALRHWIARETALPPPESQGVWEDIYALLLRRRRVYVQAWFSTARALVRARRAGRALPYGVAVVDADNRIEWLNDAFERHFEVSRRMDIGQPITNLVREPRFVDYLSSGQFDTAVQLKTARGDGLIVALQVVPISPQQRLLLSRDITESMRVETMRRDFVANVSHELRTPLTVLVGFLETISDSGINAEHSHRYLKLMSDQAKRMQQIIEDLLTLSSLESATEPSSSKRVRMGPLLNRLHAEAAGLSASRHTIEIETVSDCDLLGAETELTSAFANLVINAVRYTPAGGRIKLTWTASNSSAEFTVEDNGVGIESQHIPRLTERFYRVDRGRSRETGGTGLGLAIVKHSLLRHQAVLEIESEFGKGSRFIARFPSHRLVAAEEEDVSQIAQ